eukprot:gene17094-23391_t
MEMVEVQHEEVALCLLIHFFVHPPGSDPNLSSKRVQRQLAAFLLKQIKSTDTATLPSLRTLCESLASELREAGVELVQQLGTVLQGMTCPDDMMRLFESLGGLLVKSSSTASAASNGRIAGVDPSSPMGLFLRKCQIRFLHMTFEAVAQLYTQMVDVLHNAMQLPASNPNGEAGVARGGPGETAPGGGTLRDADDLEVFLTRQLNRAEKHWGDALDGSNGQATLPPQLDELAPDMPRVLRVHLASAMQRRDYSTAIETLHRYFDYGQGNDKAGDGQGPHIGLGHRQQNALLSLSAVHTSFGHTQEALKALNETFRLAQQAGDASCSAHALATLCQLLDSCNPGAPGFPDVSVAGGKHVTHHHVQLLRLLMSCLERGQELHSPHLTAYAKVALAKFSLQHTVEPASSDTIAAELKGGDAAATAKSSTHMYSKQAQHSSATQSQAHSAPLQVRRALRDTSLLHHAATLDAACPHKGGKGAGPAATLGGARGTGAAYPTVPPLLSLPFIKQQDPPTAQYSAAGGQFGNLTLSHLHALLHLACYSSASSSDDTALAYAQLINVAKDKHGTTTAVAISKLSEHAFPH